MFIYFFERIDVNVRQNKDRHMTQTASAYYLVHKPERLAFELVAGGFVGILILPELAPTQVNVMDVRASDKCAF